MDKPYNYTIEKAKGKNWLANFKTSSGEMYAVTFANMMDMSGVDIVVYEVQFRNRTKSDAVSITKTGDEFRVFATVMKITEDVVKKSNPEGLYFTAKEQSRRKLYEKLIKRFASKIGYELTGSGNDPDGKYFKLERK